MASSKSTDLVDTTLPSLPSGRQTPVDHDLKPKGIVDPAAVPASESDHSEASSEERLQDGVADVEAVTKIWSKKALWIAFICLYLVAFTDMLMESVQENLVAYVTSSFSKHGLLSTTNVMSSIIGGVSKLTIAKLINIWGRVHGFSFMFLLIVLGLLMKAVCQNVETYAAAQTLYWVGHLGLGYVVDVFTADISSLQNRAILFGLLDTPSIATTFAGPAIADAFYLRTGNFRWAFGAFCIIMPVTALPVALTFTMNHYKAKKLGLITRKSTTRTWAESSKYYFFEFDVVGILLVTAAFALVLLPITLASSTASKWKSGSIIAMLVIGVLCFVLFVVWEAKFAPIQFMPFKYLRDRTILGACVCNATFFMSIYSWDTYFGSYLQVVNRLSIKDSGYVNNAYSLTSSVFMPLVGWIIHRTGDCYWMGLSSVPFAALGTGLLVYFRHPGTHVGYLVMCQILNGLSGAIFPLCGRMAVMAAVGHNDVAVALALYGLSGSIGAGIGVAVAGAIWTNTLPNELVKNLPDELKGNATAIYGDITKQLSYEWGTPAREAIVASYGETMRIMAIVGACFMPLMFFSMAIWKRIDLKTIQQTKGTVA